MFAVLMAAGSALISWILPRLIGVAGAATLSVTVMTPIIDYLQAQVLQRLNGLPADGVHFLQFAGIFEAISVVFGAYTMAIGIKVTMATFRKRLSQ